MGCDNRVATQRRGPSHHNAAEQETKKTPTRTSRQNPKTSAAQKLSPSNTQILDEDLHALTLW